VLNNAYLCIVIQKQRNMVNFSKFNNIISLAAYFHSDKVCKQAIIESRLADGDIVCPYCGEHHCATRKDGRFRCKHCGKNFSCLVGTIFENTKLPLIKWFVAMYLISSHKKGISSHQLSRDIQVTQATAWYMLQKVRLLYPQNDSEAFEGTVEIEDFVRWSYHYDMWCKMWIFGEKMRQAMERDKAAVVPGRRNLMECLATNFTLDDLNMVRRAQGMKGSGADLLRKWVTRGYCTFDAAKQQYTKSEEFIRKHAKAA